MAILSSDQKNNLDDLGILECTRPIYFNILKWLKDSSGSISHEKLDQLREKQKLIHRFCQQPSDSILPPRLGLIIYIRPVFHHERIKYWSTTRWLINVKWHGSLFGKMFSHSLIDLDRVIIEDDYSGNNESSLRRM